MGKFGKYFGSLGENSLNVVDRKKIFGGLPTWNKIIPEDFLSGSLHLQSCKLSILSFSLTSMSTYTHIDKHTKNSRVLIMNPPPPPPPQSRRDRYCRPALLFKYTLRGRVSGPELPGRGQESWWLSPEPQYAHNYSCITYIRH